MTTTDLKRDALERARKHCHGKINCVCRTCRNFAAVICDAKAEEADRLGDHFRAIEYRHAAAEIREGGE